MKNKILKLLCISMMTCTLSGCTLIEILKSSIEPKTSFEFEVAEAYDDYATLVPFGRIMGGIDPRSKLTISYNNLKCTNSCVDTSDIGQLNYLNIGDQLKINFSNENFDKTNEVVKASNIEITKFSNVPEENFSLYTLIGSEILNIKSFEVMDYEEKYFFQNGVSYWVGLIHPDDTFYSFEILVYPSEDEAKGDASNMSKDGKYGGNGMSNKGFFFQKGRIIVALITGFNTYESEKATYEFLVTNFGEPFAENHPEIDYFNQ